MTKQRDWPNAMKEIRDQAADVAMDGIRTLAPLVDGERVDRTETIRRQAQALRALERIAWLLQSAGAPIRPEDLR
jgi:hypothetical protein